MALIPGKKPDPQPENQPHHDHILPDAEWAQVVKHAQQVRDADDESETE
ncbi:hypothetical protein ACX80O_02410 [Arthrobacter sp. Hz1]